MSEQERAGSQAAATEHVGGGATDSEREAVAREIGAQLKEAREAQRLSLEDVSARLKVASSKLVAIESGNVSSLPDVTFAKGVMRAYARALQVDIDGLLGRYHAQAQAAPVTGITRRNEGALNQAFDDRNRFGTKGVGGAGGRWLWLVCVLALIGVGGYFGFDHAKAWLETHSKKAAEAPAPAVEERATEQSNNDGTVSATLPPVMTGNDSPAPSEAAPASAAPAVPAAPAASAASAAPAAQATPAPAVAKKPDPATTSSGMPLATGGALTSSEAASAPAVVAVATPAVIPVATAPAAPTGAGAVQIRFSADTWYEVRDRSGKVILGGTAKAGDAVSGGGAGAPFKVILGNVKGVESLTHNGAMVNLQSANRNNVARLTLQ
ncbi:RodZ domain-containing protein [Cupriavidus sp. BIS7]|uniref:RodZ domain-containing protein n=1 Tax=Cupriavidus sp. BIS7 TaxID=1217718 RepID=UPI00030A382A|nr:RodZ domain-containing protein [Cupriavidus sp. BIS7]